MSEPIVAVDRITKRFAGHTAVDALSLTVHPGAIYGLLGPNGAGKTTTIRMIMNIIVPDEGGVRLFGNAGGARDHSARIGFLPEERGLYPKMRVLDALIFFAETKGLDRRTARAKGSAWLERLGLADWRLRKVSELSKGMQQKVQFISTVLHEPDLVILDEPFSGLDPVNAEVLKDTVLDLKRQGKTALFSTHIMEHAEKLCDQICIIAKGRKLVDGPLSALKEKHGGRHVTIAFDGNHGGAAQVFADRRLVAKVQDFGQYAELEMAEGADAQDILRALVASGARLARFELTAPSLHKIFVDLVGPEAATAAAVPGPRGGGGAPVRKVWAVIRREFIERVRTKWFWVSAILGPVFFAALIFVPVLLSRGGGIRHIVVVDGTSTGFGERVAEVLSAGRSFRARRVAAGVGVFDTLTAAVEAKRLDGFLIITDDLTETGRAEYRASNVSSIQAIEELQRALSRLIVKVRLEREGVNPAIVDRAQIPIALETKKISRGQTTTESVGGSFFMAYIMAILLFMAILLYGVNVMSSVLEEKTNRIMEVLVSSLKPFEMMLGKVLGVGAVSFFQFLIWGVSARLLFSQRQALLTKMTGEADASRAFQMPPIPATTIAVFLAFFLGGFLLYSAMFAAVGAMSGNEQEARQAQQPVTYLLMISYLSIFALTNDPNSTFSMSLSLIPFTSPIAMPVRWTAGNLPFSEVLASLAVLLVAIMGVTWIAARIYRVGILMTGKRPSIKELVRWVRAA